MSRQSRGATRPLLTIAAVAALALGGAAVAPTPAQSAAAPAPCPESFPVADLAAGQPVTGLTVSTGVTPEGFTGEVLGVLTDGIAPGLDMVIVRLTSPEIDRIGGIWAGMSGSPVYAEDGRIIGAVSYGLTWGSSPVAGVTPFDDMDNYVAPSLPKVQVSDTMARRIAKAAEVTVSQAGQGLTELRVPSGISGVRQYRLENYKKKRAYIPEGAQSVSGSRGSATVADIVDGGNLGLTSVYGDVTAGGVGTVTAVCGDRVIGFGHPAYFSGKSTALLNPAEAIYVQEDPTWGAFKVANLADPVGTITEDRLAGITGTLGVLPETTEVSSTVTYGASSRTGVSQVAVPRFSAAATYYAIIGNHDRVIDAYQGASELSTWTVAGTDEQGDPFSIDLAERYRDTSDIAWTVPWDVADMVWALTDIPDVELDSITVTGDVSDDLTMWQVKGVEVRQGGAWVPVKARGKIVATAGKDVKLRVTLDNGTTTRTQVVTVSTKARWAGARGALYVVGGGSSWSGGFWDAVSVQDVQDVADAWIRNDQVVAALGIDTGRNWVEQQSASAPTDAVVRGSRRFKLVLN